MAYFVAKTAADGLQCSDYKAINLSAMNLFQCGHVQQIEVANDEQHVFLRAVCLPEIRKDCMYKLLISMTEGLDILTAECGCPNGKGPTASCKHIGALCYAFENFCEQGSLPEFFTCTWRLQEWNRPRPRKFAPIPVLSIKEHEQTT